MTTLVDRKAERMVALMEAFRAGARLTAQQIADRYRIDHRTANRLIASVEQFLPFERTHSGGVVVYRMWKDAV